MGRIGISLPYSRAIVDEDIRASGNGRCRREMTIMARANVT
ncbi:hypothetical protein PSE_1197 [Pseudovibrio sp. FO-BEG1]|nr:hypothetical protein PSE_1197 [Pseudovibrio sp. FO-BEG1]